MSISKLRDRVRKELLEFAWSQWAQLGLSAHATRVDRWAVDPEGLILFTVEVARRDPRLFDELLDWVSLNARLLSLQRLRNLVRRFALDPGLLDAVVSWVGESNPSVGWSRGKTRRDRGKAKGVPVFGQDVVSFVGEPDPLFERQGYLRPRAELSGKSTGPDLRATVNFAFRLRLLFGPGARSEVMRVFLTFTEGPLDAARIAEETGFAKRNINETLNAFVASGVVRARWSGNERIFAIARDRWADLLEICQESGDLPAFVSWVHLLPVLLEVLWWLEERSEEAESEYMMSSRARDLVERIAADLEVVGITPPRDSSLRGAAYLPAFVDTVETLLVEIGGKS